MKNNFAVFIISHGRANNIKTIESLKKSNYTGKTYIIIDNEDKTCDQYFRKFGKDKVIVFDKQKYADLTDEGNNFDDRRTTTHARNACFDIAINLGIEYFCVLDDDYTSFLYRYESKDGQRLISQNVNLDIVFEIYLDFYKKSNFISIAFAQGGDLIGGVGNIMAKNRNLSRKCMNSFICSVHRKFQFVGQLNEDVNTYVVLGSRGELFGTLPFVFLTQTPTQKTKSGMTDAYIRYGTYCKSFTTVMMAPSCVKVSMMHTTNNRLHHSVNWVNTTPMILSEKHKK